jgi:hypothetical protein
MDLPKFKPTNWKILLSNLHRLRRPHHTLYKKGNCHRTLLQH